MTQVQELAGDFVVRTPLPAQGTADTEENYTVLRAEKDLEVVACRLIFDSAVTGAATNHAAFGLVNKGANGAGTTAITGVKAYANGVNAAAHVPDALTLSATEADRRVAAGSVVALARTTPGTGMATPRGIVETVYRYR